MASLSEQDLLLDSFGKKLSEFPLLFSAPLLFGDSANTPGEKKLNNGTASLINLPRTRVAVTCAHVIREYERALASNPRAICQIGNVPVNLLAQRIDIDDALDLATISLSEQQARELKETGNLGTEFFSPAIWPPSQVAQGEVVWWLPGGMASAVA